MNKPSGLRVSVIVAMSENRVIGRAGTLPWHLRADLRTPYSNIHRGDYVGPKVCGECHEENYAAWRAHPHSRGIHER